MKNRFWIFRRGSTYYIEDAVTGAKESLRTKDKKEAERLRLARNEAVAQPNLNLALGRAYLAAHDPLVPKRTWRLVMDAFIARSKKPSTRLRRERALAAPVFKAMRERRILETTSDDLHVVLHASGAHANATLRCLHNLALGLGWLQWSIIPAKLWPTCAPKFKRAITQAEHQAIIAAEGNRERKLFYQVLWEIGAAQSDAAQLMAEYVDWPNKTISYQRQKNGSWSHLSIGTTLASILEQLPKSGPLFPSIYATSANDRAAEFYRRCKLLNIKGVSLHSYRYSLAERAKAVGMPERFAMEMLGHNSKAVHRAYAKGARVSLPSLEEYEKGQAQPS